MHSENFIEEISRLSIFFAGCVIFLLIFIAILYFLGFYKNPLKIIVQRSKKLNMIIDELNIDDIHLSKSENKLKKSDSFEKLKSELTLQKRLAQAFLYDNSDVIEIRKIIDTYDSLLEYLSVLNKKTKKIDTIKTELLKKYSFILKLNEEIINKF